MTQIYRLGATYGTARVPSHPAAPLGERARGHITLAVLLTAAAVTFSMTKQYTATTRLFFAVSGTETVTDLAQGSTFAEKQMTSYAQVATSPLVLDPVIRDLGLATTATELAKSVSATVSTGTVILGVAATSPSRR
jgi:capsular polysaccharide biosynthesis protein